MFMPQPPHGMPWGERVVHAFSMPILSRNRVFRNSHMSIPDRRATIAASMYVASESYHILSPGPYGKDLRMKAFTQ